MEINFRQSPDDLELLDNIDQNPLQTTPTLRHNMQPAPDDPTRAVLFPSSPLAMASISSDLQSTFYSPQCGIHGNITDSNPMPKAWMEYHRAKESYSPVSNWAGPTMPPWQGDPSLFGPSLNTNSNFQAQSAPGASEPSEPSKNKREKSEIEESQALKKAKVTSLQRRKKIPEKQHGGDRSGSPRDIQEKLKATERKVSALTKTNQFLLGKLSEVEKSREATENSEKQEELSTDELRDKAKFIEENALLKAENQTLKENNGRLLQENSCLKAELASAKQELKELRQENNYWETKVLQLQNEKLNLEQEMKLLKMDGRKAKHLPEGAADDGYLGQVYEQQLLYLSQPNATLHQHICSLEGKQRGLEEKILEMDAQIKSQTSNRDSLNSSHSDEQMKELLIRLDATTSENLYIEHTEVPVTHTSSESSMNAKDILKLENWFTSVSQSSLDNKIRQLQNTLEDQNTEEVDILRTKKPKQDSNKEISVRKEFEILKSKVMKIYRDKDRFERSLQSLKGDKSALVTKIRNQEASLAAAREREHELEDSLSEAHKIQNQLEREIQRLEEQILKREIENELYDSVLVENSPYKPHEPQEANAQLAGDAEGLEEEIACMQEKVQGISLDISPLNDIVNESSSSDSQLTVSSINSSVRDVEKLEDLLDNKMNGKQFLQQELQNFENDSTALVTNIQQQEMGDIIQRLSLTLSSLSIDNNSAEEGSKESADQQIFTVYSLEQIEKQINAIVQENNELHRNIYLLNEHNISLEDQVKRTGHLDSETKDEEDEIEQHTLEVHRAQGLQKVIHDKNSIIQELKILKFSLNEKQSIIEGLTGEKMKLLKKTKEAEKTIAELRAERYELQGTAKEEVKNIQELNNEKKLLEDQTKRDEYLLQMAVEEKEKAFRDIAVKEKVIQAMEKEKEELAESTQKVEHSHRAIIAEWNAYKEETKERKNALRRRVEELQEALVNAKDELSKSSKAKNKLNDEKEAMLATLKEVKGGLAKASSRVKELETNLEKTTQGQERLNVTIRKIYDDFKLEQEEKIGYRSAVEALREENVNIMVELKTARGVLQKQIEAKSIMKERELAMQVVLDEAKRSRELLDMELKRLMNNTEKRQKEAQLLPQILDQVDEQRIQKLREILKRINSRSDRKSMTHSEQLKELGTLKDEIRLLKGENGSLKKEVTRLREKLDLYEKEHPKLGSVSGSYHSNGLYSDTDEPEPLPDRTSKQKLNAFKKTFKRRLSRPSGAKVNPGENFEAGIDLQVKTSSSSELHYGLENRIYQLEQEVTLLRKELGKQTEVRNDDQGMQKVLEQTLNESGTSEASKEGLSHEDRGLSAELHSKIFQTQYGQELEQATKEDTELQVLKESLEIMLEKIRKQLEARDIDMRRLSEEIQSKDRELLTSRDMCKVLEVEGDRLKEENRSLTAALEHEIDLKTESVEKQKHLESLLRDELKAKADTDHYISHFCSAKLWDGESAPRKEAEELRDVLQSIYDPIDKQLQDVTQRAGSSEFKGINNETGVHNLSEENANLINDMQLTMTELVKESSSRQNLETHCNRLALTLGRRMHLVKSTLGKLEAEKVLMENELKSKSKQLEKERRRRRNSKELENALHESQAVVAKLEKELQLLMERLTVAEESNSRMDDVLDSMKAKLQEYSNALKKAKIEKQEAEDHFGKSVEENGKRDIELNAIITKLRNDLKLAEDNTINLRSTFAFITCTNKSFEAEVRSLRTELDKEISSKCEYRDREATLQGSLSSHKEELDRLRGEVEKLYECLKKAGSEKLELEKVILTLTAENASLKATTYASPSNLLDSEKLQHSLKEASAMIRQLQEETKRSEEELIRRLKQEQEQREKAETEIRNLKHLSKRTEEQQATMREKLRGKLTKTEEKLVHAVQKSVEDQEKIEQISEKLVKCIEEKTKTKDEARKAECQRKQSINDQDENAARMQDFIAELSATKTQNDEAIRARLRVFETEKEALAQQLQDSEETRNKLEEQTTVDINRLRRKIQDLEEALKVTKEEKTRLEDDNKKIEEDARKLSEQVSEEVENVRDESREIEGELRKTIERLQVELKASEEQVAEEHESYVLAVEDLKRVTKEYEICKIASEELRQIQESTISLRDEITNLKDDLKRADEEKVTSQEAAESLMKKAKALYVEVITLKAQLEIVTVDNRKTAERNAHLQLLFDEADAARKELEAEVKSVRVLLHEQENRWKEMIDKEDSQHLSRSSVNISEEIEEFPQNDGKLIVIGEQSCAGS